MNLLGIGPQERFDASERFVIAGCVASLRVLSQLTPPAVRRVVIVSAGESDGILRVVRGQMRSVFAESELHDGKAREAKLIPKRFHFRTDHSEIFRDDGCITKLLLDCFK